MRRFNIAYTLGCIALAALTLQGCNRDGGLDNLNVITKPYSLFFADTSGAIFSTNDGQRFEKVMGPDRADVQTLATSGKNVLMVKARSTTLFVSDGGMGLNANFNPSFSDINPIAFGTSLLINLPGYNDTGAAGVKDRIYISSNPLTKTRGLFYQDHNANRDSLWLPVIDYVLKDPNDPNSKYHVSATSFARQENGSVVAYDNANQQVWVKENLQDQWKIKQILVGGTFSNSGIPPNTKTYIITQKNDILAVSVDAGSANPGGIWRSIDNGITFVKMPSFSGDTAITCAAAPFGKVLIACTRHSGIWRFTGTGGTWVPANIGLKDGARIYAISFQDNKFKNEKSGEYVFIGTSDGVYRSDDLGQTWIQMDVPAVPGVKSSYTEIH